MLIYAPSSSFFHFSPFPSRRNQQQQLKQQKAGIERGWTVADNTDSPNASTGPTTPADQNTVILGQPASSIMTITTTVSGQPPASVLNMTDSGDGLDPMSTEVIAQSAPPAAQPTGARVRFGNEPVVIAASTYEDDVDEDDDELA